MDRPEVKKTELLLRQSVPRVARQATLPRHPRAFTEDNEDSASIIPFLWKPECRLSKAAEPVITVRISRNLEASAIPLGTQGRPEQRPHVRIPFPVRRLTQLFGLGSLPLLWRRFLYEQK